MMSRLVRGVIWYLTRVYEFSLAWERDGMKELNTSLCPVEGHFDSCYEALPTSSSPG